MLLGALHTVAQVAGLDPRGTEDRAALGEDAAHRVKSQGAVDALQKASPAVLETDDLVAVVDHPPVDHGADHSVQAGAVTAAGQHTNTHCFATPEQNRGTAGLPGWDHAVTVAGRSRAGVARRWPRGEALIVFGHWCTKGDHEVEHIAGPCVRPDRNRHGSGAIGAPVEMLAGCRGGCAASFPIVVRIRLSVGRVPAMRSPGPRPRGSTKPYEAVQRCTKPLGWVGSTRAGRSRRSAPPAARRTRWCRPAGGRSRPARA